MRRNNGRWLVMLCPGKDSGMGRILLVLLAFAFFVELKLDGQTPRKDQVSTAALSGGSVEVIGSLGFPLGTIVTIGGYWQEPKSPSKIEFFKVTAVNGKKLGMDCFLNVVGHQRQPANVACVYKGYQTGGWFGSPSGRTQAVFGFRETFVVEEVMVPTLGSK